MNKVKSFIIVILLVIFLNPSSNAKNRWKVIPSFKGATTTCLKVHPSGKIFLGSLYEGLYVSDDGGNSWKTAFTYEGTFSQAMIRNIIVDNSGLVYVLTEAIPGIFMSKDDGYSWEKLTWPGSSTTIIFTITSDQNGNLYAGSNGIIYKSVDHGKSWSVFYEHEKQYSIWNIIALGSEIYATMNGYGIIYSRDGGTSWTFKYGPAGGYYWVFTMISKSEFLLSCEDMVYPHTSGVFRTSDAGNSWTNVGNKTSSPYFSSIEKLPDGTLLAGADYGKIYKSIDRGWNWQQLSYGKVSTNVNSIAVYNKRILAGSRYGGVILSDNQGIDWNFSNTGFPVVKTRAIAKFSNGDFLYGTFGGCYCYEVKTNQFHSRSTFYNYPVPNYHASYVGTEVYDIFIDSKDVAYLATYQGGIYTSTDYGKTWNWINSNTNVSAIKWLYKTNSNLMFISLSNEKGVFLFDGNNKSWIKTIDNYELEKPINDTNGKLYMTDRRSLYKSTDEGSSWNKITSLNAEISGCFISKQNTIVTYTVNGMYTSYDEGENWVFTDKSVIENSFAPANRRSNQYAQLGNNHFIVTTGYSTFDSYDGGRTWQREYDELDGKSVEKFISLRDGTVLAVLKTDLLEFVPSTSDINEKEIFTSFNLSQNYPNPFNPETTIKYSIPSNEFVTIKVYNMLGKEIKTLVNEQKPAGNYSVNFTANDIASGIYLYKITAGKFQQSYKMILLK